MLGCIPELICIPIIFICYISSFFVRRINIRKRKDAYLSAGLPLMLEMLKKIEFKNAFHDEDEYRKNSFIKVSFDYLNGNKKEIEKLYKCVFIDEFFCNNKYGIMLGSLLANLQENRMVFLPSKYPSYAWYYLENFFDETLKNKPILEYYFTLIKTKTLLIRDSRPYICSFAYDVEFGITFEKTVKNIWNRINNTSIVNKEFGNNGVKFGKYLFLIFKNEVYENEINKLLKSELKVYDHEFELLFLGVSDPDELVFDIYDNETGFKMQANVNVCNFAVFKNLNYSPYEKQSIKEERLKKEKDNKEKEEKEKEEKEREEKERAERKRRKKEKREREERKKSEGKKE
ncbi:hypothetical protein H312_03093 [Anncaliia algerae PRA339]|uniref:Uncharacterized protein n=1 Tax=Anncaliia algerae PRA339 TaxID=1288291 RepID=A0A059EX89_9MICR|nr:hypothetical protein H312_03093 [Anncaliia algerae PRA339]